jgi:DEAD/DEAH box helicase domain-containing protein
MLINRLLQDEVGVQLPGIRHAGLHSSRNKQILDTVDLDTAPWIRDTQGLWIDVPRAVLGLMREKGINAAEAIHAAQHAFLNQFAMAADLKTECKPAEKEYAARQTSRKRPGRLIFYDPAGKTGSTAVRAFDNGECPSSVVPHAP